MADPISLNENRTVAQVVAFKQSFFIVDVLSDNHKGYWHSACWLDVRLWCLWLIHGIIDQQTLRGVQYLQLWRVDNGMLYKM